MLRNVNDSVLVDIANNQNLIFEVLLIFAGIFQNIMSVKPALE